MKAKIIHIIIFCALIFLALFINCSETEIPVYMANGIKIGEVTQNSAIIWVRLTKHPERNIGGQPFAKSEKRDVKPPFEKLEEMEGATPGILGEVRIIYRPNSGSSEQKSMMWKSVQVEKDFTLQFPLNDLLPGVVYSIIVEGRAVGSNEASCVVEGSFVTAPSIEDPAKVSFTVVTGQDYPRRDDFENGHKIYPLSLIHISEPTRPY